MRHLSKVLLISGFLLSNLGFSASSFNHGKKLATNVLRRGFLRTPITRLGRNPNGRRSLTGFVRRAAPVSTNIWQRTFNTTPDMDSNFGFQTKAFSTKSSAYYKGTYDKENRQVILHLDKTVFQQGESIDLKNLALKYCGKDGFTGNETLDKIVVFSEHRNSSRLGLYMGEELAWDLWGEWNDRGRFYNFLNNKTKRWGSKGKSWILKVEVNSRRIDSVTLHFRAKSWFFT